MSEETKILKPQSPLMRGSDYVLPLTTADQVVLENGQRLEQNGKIVADIVRGVSGEFITIDVPAANWVQQDDGRWTNTVEVTGVTAETRGRYADIDLSEVTPETYDSFENAWLKISMIKTVDGGIQLTAFRSSPEIDIAVSLEVLI